MSRKSLAHCALEHLTVTQRLAITARAWQRVDFMTRNGLWMIVGLAVLAVAGIMSSAIDDRPFAFANMRTVIAILLWVAFFVFLYVEYRRSVMKIRRAIAAELVAAGIRPLLCLCCGYNLHGTVGDECPECGEALAAVDGSDREADE